MTVGGYLPATMGTEFWSKLFGREGPVEVEIGPGTGTFLRHEATRRPHTNFFAVEASRSRAQRLATLIEKLALPNVRVLHAPAQCAVRLTPNESVTAYHIYFPDPWWKRRHHKRRLFTGEFAQELVRTLSRDGRVYVATDVFLVWTLARECLERSGLQLSSLPPPTRPAPTAFEQKGLRRGAQIWQGTFTMGAAPGARSLPDPAKSWHKAVANQT